MDSTPRTAPQREVPERGCNATIGVAFLVLIVGAASFWLGMLEARRGESHAILPPASTTSASPVNR